MELYQLAYFLEAARQKNFTRAAACLHLAQAALSEQIRKLEAELGTPLFQRGRRESVLTAAGETLRTHAIALLERAEAAKQAVQAIAGLRGGRLTIGSIPSVSACLLPKAVAAFRRRHPLVELGLMEGTSEAVSEWVDSGRVELGLIQLPAGNGNFEEEIILCEEFVLLAPRAHPLAKAGLVALGALARESFVVYKGRVRSSALTACRAAGFEPQIACESSELETIRSLVAAGLGIAILPRLATQRATPGCVAVPLSGPPIERQVAILSKCGHSPSPGATVLRSILIQCCEKSAAEGIPKS